MKGGLGPVGALAHGVQESKDLLAAGLTDDHPVG
jgi:hypothetical protein